MKASVGFIFFMLFLAGLALVNVKSMNERSNSVVTAESGIANTTWRPTHIGEMRLPEDSKMRLQFNSDNSVAGHSGCNRFFGAYQIREGTVVFGLVDTGSMTCPEPLKSFEISFLEALQSTRALSRSESRLAMRDDKGVVVARFVTTEQDEPQE